MPKWEMESQEIQTGIQGLETYDNAPEGVLNVLKQM